MVPVYIVCVNSATATIPSGCWLSIIVVCCCVCLQEVTSSSWIRCNPFSNIQQQVSPSPWGGKWAPMCYRGLPTLSTSPLLDCFPLSSALVALRRGPNVYPFIVCTTTNQPHDLIASYIWIVSLGKSCSLTAVKPKISNFRPRPCLLKLALSIVMALNAAIRRGSASGAAISHCLWLQNLWLQTSCCHGTGDSRWIIQNKYSFPLMGRIWAPHAPCNSVCASIYNAKHGTNVTLTLTL